MSKRTRKADNSKRQQPVQQQRAQARQTMPGQQANNGSREPRGQAPRDDAQKR